MHLKKYSILILLFLLGACNTSSKKMNTKTAANLSVYTKHFTKQQIDSVLINYKNQNKFEKEILKQWLDTELLFNEAIFDSLNYDKEFLRIFEQSKKELLAAFYLDKKIFSQKINISENEIYNFYRNKKEEFKLTEDSFIISLVAFEDKNLAYGFREYAFKNSWIQAKSKFYADCYFAKEDSLIASNDVYATKLIQIINVLQPNEISVPFTIEDSLTYVVKYIGKLNKFEVPDYKYVKNDIKKRVYTHKLKRLYKNLMQSIYTKYNIEIN